MTTAVDPQLPQKAAILAQTADGRQQHAYLVAELPAVVSMKDESTPVTERRGIEALLVGAVTHAKAEYERSKKAFDVAVGYRNDLGANHLDGNARIRIHKGRESHQRGLRTRARIERVATGFKLRGNCAENYIRAVYLKWKRSAGDLASGSGCVTGISFNRTGETDQTAFYFEFAPEPP